jgi:lipopolysaccharide transport system permease protein
MFRLTWQHRELVALMVQREIVGRYRGSLLGVAWSLLTPLVMLTAYTFVFSVVLRVRWGTDQPDAMGHFAVMLFIGLLIHGFFAECLLKAPGLLLAHSNLVKKVVFPLAILPLVTVGSALFNCFVNLLALLAAMLVLAIPLPPSALLLPIALLPITLFTLGVAWLVAALGVFLRDLGQVAGMMSTLLLFMAPVFYPQSALPEAYRHWMYLNPLTFPIESTRAVLLNGLALDWTGWAISFCASLLIAWAGFTFFQRSSRGFADVL